MLHFVLHVWYNFFAFRQTLFIKRERYYLNFAYE